MVTLCLHRNSCLTIQISIHYKSSQKSSQNIPISNINLKLGFLFWQSGAKTFDQFLRTVPDHEGLLCYVKYVQQQ